MNNYDEKATGRCLVCPALPTVIVADPVGDQALLCTEHWQEALRCSDGLIRAIGLYRQPLDPVPEPSPTATNGAETPPARRTVTPTNGGTR